MMKIFLIAPGSDFTTQLRKAFAQEGHTLAYINTRGLRAWPVLWRIIRRIPILRRASNALLGRRIVARVRTFSPDLVFVCKGMTVKEPTLRTLRDMGVKLANWFPENSINEPYKSWLDRHIGFYDFFFSFDSDIEIQQSQFPNTKCRFLPFGVDPDAFSTSELSAGDHARYDCDVCFVGAWYPEREGVLSALAGLNLKIFGWKGWERSSLARYYHGPLNAQESAKAYRCAKVVINMNTEPAVSGINLKTFEICAAGGFQLTDFRTDLSRFFSEGSELAIFRSPEELKDKIQYYLAHPQEREHVANAGHERTVHEHTMRHRVRTIISTVT